MPVHERPGLLVVERREQPALQRRPGQAEPVVGQRQDVGEPAEEQPCRRGDESVAVRARWRDHITSRRYRNWYPNIRGQTRVATRSVRSAAAARRSRAREPPVANMSNGVPTVARSVTRRPHVAIRSRSSPGEEPQVATVERAALVVVEAAQGGAAAGVPVSEVRHRDQDLATGFSACTRSESSECGSTTCSRMSPATTTSNAPLQGVGERPVEIRLDEGVDPLSHAVELLHVEPGHVMSRVAPDELGEPAVEATGIEHSRGRPVGEPAQQDGVGAVLRLDGVAVGAGRRDSTTEASPARPVPDDVHRDVARVAEAVHVADLVAVVRRDRHLDDALLGGEEAEDDLGVEVEPVGVRRQRQVGERVDAVRAVAAVPLRELLHR